MFIPAVSIDLTSANAELTFSPNFLICMRNSQIIYLFLRHFSFKLLCFKKLLQTDLQQKLNFYSYLKKAETPTLFLLIFKLKFFGLKFQI